MYITEEDEKYKNKNKNREMSPRNNVVFSGQISFQDRIKLFSGGNKTENDLFIREAKTFNVQRSNIYDIKEKNSNHYDSSQNVRKNDYIITRPRYGPKRNMTVQIDNNNSNIKEEEIQKENFIEGINYDKYLSQLNSQKKKEYETGREAFCEGFFISSFPQKEGKVIENSQSFPSPCGHKECSDLPAMKPEIISRYPLKDTKTLELNNLAATICFPTGIKVCYSEDKPSMITDYVTPITNQKGERYYMMTYHFYHKIMNDVYTKLYEMHPLKHHLMKFGDSYLNMKDEEMDENITNQIQERLERAQELGFRDYVFVPYCISLISKYPYVTEMKKCLHSIYLLFINYMNNNKNKSDLNNLIMYLIHSVPIPERHTKVKFFIPYNTTGIDLICPKVQDISVMNTNISKLLKYFSIDKLVIIFRIILFEKKILFIDNNYTRLSFITDGFISLLYPFQWVHTYIPIMSDQMLKYLEAFLPFLNGINSSLMDLVTQVFINNENEDNEEVFIVYITKDKFRLGSSLTTNNKEKYKYLKDNVPALPSNMEKELKNKLKKIKDELDVLLKNQNQKDNRIDTSDIDFRIRNVFIEMFVQMFHDYYKYMTFIDDDVVFNKKLFLEKITNSNDKHFYEEFLDTQLFQQFTQNIVKDELNYFTNMAMDYDPNKKDFKRSLTTKINQEKLYVIKPNYLEINWQNSKQIEKSINSRYKIKENEDKKDLRIVTEIDNIKDEYYNNQKCYIYTLPESLMQNNKQNEKKKDNDFYKAMNFFKEKSTKNFKDKGSGLSEREKDNIKEMIKEFTIKIFKSEEIEEDNANLKKDLLNALNTSFGRDFFVNILSKNINNIILLKEKSFQLLGTLIYNSLLQILNIEESNTILEDIVILIKSTKYFGQEEKGRTLTLWEVYKTRFQTYSKINQGNFWNKWYELEIKKEQEVDDAKKEKNILNICDIMINLEITKSFVKNVSHGLCNKIFGKESEQAQATIKLITEKIIKARYISRAI